MTRNKKEFVRPDWDEQFMFMANQCAARHSCLKRGVGAVLIDRYKRVIGSGYNGAAGGIDSCRELGYCYYEMLAWQESKSNSKKFEEVREIFKVYCQAVHAESNAISQCSRKDAEGAVFYLTNYPCPKCTQDVIINYKLGGVRVWKEYLRDSLLTIDEQRASERKLIEAGIPVKFVKLTEQRIMEIAAYMANQVGERNDYKFNGGEKG